MGTLTPYLCLLLGALVGSGLTYLTIRNKLSRKDLRSLFTLKRTIKDLEFERKLLMRAQDNMLIVLDDKHLIKLANKDAIKFFGKKNITQRHYTEIIKIPELLSTLDEAIQTQQALKRELLLTVESDDFQAGEERCFQVSIKFIDGDHHDKHTRIHLHDITEQYRTEQMRKDFIANASHELRTPLAIINGYVETLMDEDIIEDTETSQHFLGIMKKHGQRLARIIEEMLLITKLESGVKNTLNYEPFRLKEIIDECIVHLDQMIKEKGVIVKIKMDEPDLTIEADKFYWSQILFNLVENAIKQNPERQLKVKIGCTQCKRTGKIKIWVSDNGVGIPAADLPYIFRRFYRVEKHHSQYKIKGTGLGLSIVKRAVEAHQGTIKCDSIQDQLTRFSISLPPTMRVEDLSAK